MSRTELVCKKKSSTAVLHALVMPLEPRDVSECRMLDLSSSSFPFLSSPPALPIPIGNGASVVRHHRKLRSCSGYAIGAQLSLKYPTTSLDILECREPSRRYPFRNWALRLMVVEQQLPPFFSRVCVHAPSIDGYQWLVPPAWDEGADQRSARLLPPLYHRRSGRRGANLCGPAPRDVPARPSRASCFLYLALILWFQALTFLTSYLRFSGLSKGKKMRIRPPSFFPFS